MNNNINNKKACSNCVHYMQHYVVCRGQFSKISNGHCLNTKPNGQFRKTDNPCDFFMEKDAQKEREEQMKYATEWLSIIAERLSELTQILKDE